MSNYSAPSKCHVLLLILTCTYKVLNFWFTPLPLLESDSFRKEELALGMTEKWVLSN